MCFLFHGPSGTGKTQAAKSLSQRLKKPLLIVDHAKLLDKYVGETEKRIAEVFKYAEDTGCLLLFDEADSLIGSRNDAEHSWEIGRINTLLQHMERSNSVTIFATNYADNLDSAINRRLLFKVSFTLPDEKSRVAIWKALVPKKAPKAKINYNELGKIEMTGGEIKNAIVVAVVSAANTQAKITTELLTTGANTVVSERLVDLFKEEKLKDAKKGGIGFKKLQTTELS
jgi:SpoVK/Ycf46/Vps4 family AAA+-type ATPase